MGLTIPPTIYIAGPNPNGPPLSAAPGRMPIRHPPIPEPAPVPTNGERAKTASSMKGIEQPISLPDANGRVSANAKTGATISLKA